MSLISGEDTESSDEEINTDQFHEQKPTGEDREEKNEDNASSTVSGSMDSLNIGTSRSKETWDPPSLLHKKLGEANLNIRKNIVERFLKLYHITCDNLTLVNDNLSKTQGIIEKINANVKKSDQDLERLKNELDDIFMLSQSLAPTLRNDIVKTDK